MNYDTSKINLKKIVFSVSYSLDNLLLFERRSVGLVSAFWEKCFGQHPIFDYFVLYNNLSVFEIEKRF